MEVLPGPPNSHFEIPLEPLGEYAKPMRGAQFLWKGYIDDPWLAGMKSIRPAFCCDKPWLAKAARSPSHAASGTFVEACCPFTSCTGGSRPRRTPTVTVKSRVTFQVSCTYISVSQLAKSRLTGAPGASSEPLTV